MNRVDTFLKLAVKQGGSDLHLVSGQAPRIRINGALDRVRFRELSVEDVHGMLQEFMPEGVRARVEQGASADFGYTVPELGRFRVNVYRHVAGIAVAMRVIPQRIPTLDELGLPAAVKQIVSQPKGLILVTGPAGCGKSTTLAAIIDHINATRHGHIITLEDPIEFVHWFKQCVVTQRELYAHVPTLAEGLRNALREDPDVILIGELRDPESIGLALTAAETGTQVFASLHTVRAVQTIDRIVNVFSTRRQDQVRSMLADSLRMIVSQRLVRHQDGTRRQAVAEVLVNTLAVKSVIRSGQTHKLESVIQSGAQVGMQSLGVALKGLVDKGMVSAEEAAEQLGEGEPSGTVQLQPALRG